MTDTTTNPLYEAALDYLAHGWTPTPLRSKVPTQKRWTGLRPSGADCWGWWVEDTHDGIGVVCGQASGNLLTVDLESELVADAERMGRVIAAANEAGVTELFASFRSAAATTPSGGRHLFFRITDGPAPGNEKLAFRDVGDKAVLLVETRGEGGQVAAPPGDGRSWIGDSGPGKAIDVTLAQMQALLDCFRLLDESGIKAAPTREAKPWTPDTHREPTVADAWTIPLMDGRITWADVLDEGWIANGYDDEGRSLWVRPDYGDKTKALYSAKGFEHWTGGRIPVLVNHSSSVPHLPEGGRHKITPARAWAHCFFDGDDRAALAALEGLVTDGHPDPRIVRDVPTAVLEEAARIVASRPPRAPEIQAWDLPEDDDFFDSRDYLTWIRQHARAVRVSPWALLGVVLTRTACEIQPHVVTPDLVGSYGSLNVLTALVGPSGSGKSAAIRASAEAHHWRYKPRKLGSGEGLTDLYGSVKKEQLPDGRVGYRTVQHATSAMAIVPEIDQIAALAARSGATLMTTLRETHAAEQLGFGYRDALKAVQIDADSYRFGLVAGVQPSKSGALLGDAGGGTPQRFIWMSAIDPGAMDVRPPKPEGSMPWRVQARFTEGSRGMNVVVAVCDEARAEVDAHQLAKTRGEKGDDDSGIEGHRLFNRIKWAALLALLDGRDAVSDEDWALTLAVMRHSDGAARWCQQVLADERHASARARVRTELTVRDEVEEKIADARVARIAKRMAAVVNGDGGRVTHGALRKRLGSKEREHFDDAMDLAETNGWVTVTDGPVYHPGVME